jgi:putative hydrolase of the HAD superfamily
MPIRWVLFDWGGTLMLEDGPPELPMAQWPTLHTVDGAFALLSTLARERRLGLATNAAVSDRALIEQALERVQLRQFLSALFCYRELGVKKWEPAFWDCVVAQLGVTREEILMVGDDVEQDVLAPQRAGIAAVWLNRDGALAPATSQIIPIRSIARLDELPAMLAVLDRR